MELPPEIWGAISGYLSVSDKCSMVATCRSIQQTLYNDLFWLDFTLKNLLRGLTIEEIIVIVFLKADQQRMLKSRISKIQNYLKIKYAISDIEEILASERQKSSSDITVGKLEGNPWRDCHDFTFSLNFVALFCRPEALNVRGPTDYAALRMLFELHGTSIKHFATKAICLDDWDFSVQLPNLESAVLLPDTSYRVNSSASQLPTTLTKLSVSTEDIDYERLTQLRSFKQNSPASSDSGTVNSRLLKFAGSTLESLTLPVLTEENVKELVARCTKLRSLWVYDKQCPSNLFVGLDELAKGNNEFPRMLRLEQNAEKKAPSELFGADKFFMDFGSRLRKLTLRNLPYSITQHLANATNLVELDLTLRDAQSKADGEANVKVPQVISRLTKLEKLTLDLSTTFQTTIEHPHLTSLSICATNVVINVPSLLELFIQRHTSVVTVRKCALKVLQILSTNVAFNAQQVSWSALEKLMLRSVSLNYWTFVDQYWTRDSPRNLKSLEIDRHPETFFRATSNKMLMPKRVRLEWPQLAQLNTGDDYAVPQELVLLGAPPNGLAGYQALVEKFTETESLDFLHCGDMTTEVLDILCEGLPNLKRIGFTESRDVNAPFSHLKLHSKSLELIYLYHIHSVETSDIVCPNLRTITFDNAGRFRFLDEVTDTNFCEMTLQQLGESNACPNLTKYYAYPTQTHQVTLGEVINDPAKPVTLTKIPRGLTVLRLYLNSNLIAVDVESSALRECSINACYHVKSIKLKADVLQFYVDEMPLEHLTLNSKLLRNLELPIERIPYVELITPTLRLLSICAPTSDHFLEHLQQLEKLKITTVSPYIVNKTLFAKLIKCCPKLKIFEWHEKCRGISAASLLALKNAYKAQHGTELKLQGTKDLLDAVANLEAHQKLPEKKQRMIRINTLMKRTITNWKQKPKAKAFRAWRDYALRDKKHDKK